jgi:myo-inositol-1(or 4)-monophosphatase
LPAPDPATDLALLIEATEAAGRIALSYWRQAPKAWEKAAEAGPVSEADLAVDAALAAGLRAARPDYGWLSEETPDDPARLSRDRVFILDPIDGTRAFLAGEETFSVSLAVATAGLVTAAVVHLPARGETYAAHLDGEARLNGRILHASPRREVDGADVLTTRANLAPEAWPGGVPDLKRSFRASLAWRLCLAAEGRHDAMLTLRDTWEWDCAAGSLIAAQAGCVVSDRHGAPLRFNRPVPQAAGVIAAPAALHAGLMARLRP